MVCLCACGMCVSFFVTSNFFSFLFLFCLVLSCLVLSCLVLSCLELLGEDTAYAETSRQDYKTTTDRKNRQVSEQTRKR